MSVSSPPSETLPDHRPDGADAWVVAPLIRPIRRARRIVVRGLLMVGLVLLSLFGSLVALYETTNLPRIPPLAQTSVLLDRTGAPIARVNAGIDRTKIPIERMPRSLREAVVAVEDADFYRHDGVDLSAVARAALKDVASGSMSQGGSTITQQYVKNVLTGSERSIGRKVREAILALKLERTESKDEILEGYLNTVYLGHGAYGVQAAAETYFDRDAADLSLAQSATLAGLIAAPSARDPFEHPRAALRYRNYVLDRMVQVEAIPRSLADAVEATPLDLAKERRVPSPAPYFVEYVRAGLESSFGPDALYRGGLRVRTSIDLGWQRAAERAVDRFLPASTDPDAALVAIDPRTGAIRAMVGGRNFDRREFNLATQGRRQAGSAFKPFVLLAALEQGISPLEVRNGPPRLTIRDPLCRTRGGPWTVTNAGDESAGTMSIENAMAGSVNTIFAQLTVQVGPEAVADVAHRMGIESPLQPVCSIGLGTSDVSPLEMTSAFATLAAHGMYVPPIAVEEVRGSGGEIVQGPPGDLSTIGTRAVSAQDADAATQVLTGVIEHGTGTAARLAGRPAAGQKGTAEDNTDAWFCGYTPQLATCVWVGYPTGARPMTDVEGVPVVYGGTIPAEIWQSFMAEATAGMPVVPFRNVSYDVYAAEVPTPPTTIGPAPGAIPSASVAPAPSVAPSVAPSPQPSPSPAPSPPPPSPSSSPSPSPTDVSPSPQGSPSPGAARSRLR
jgi:penicillin-binding protein 1A